MTLTLSGLLILLLIAGLCGAIGRGIGGGNTRRILRFHRGCFVGALFGTFIAGYMHLPELLMVAVDGHRFPILWSIIGAALFVALVHLVSGGPRRRVRYD